MSWQPLLTLPFEVSNGQLSLINDDTITWQGNDSIYYFDISHKKTIIKSKNSIIQSFCSAGVKQLILSTGSSGCFHSYGDELVYDYIDNGFTLNDQRSYGSTHSSGLNSGIDFIDADVVENFVKQIPLFINKKATIEDLGLRKMIASVRKLEVKQIFNHH